MTLIAWTIRRPGRQDIAEVTTVHELEEIMRALDLPNITPAEAVTIEVVAHYGGSYSHDLGGPEEWSLTWTRLDDTA